VRACVRLSAESAQLCGPVCRGVRHELWPSKRRTLAHTHSHTQRTHRSHSLFRRSPPARFLNLLLPNSSANSGSLRKKSRKNKTRTINALAVLETVSGGRRAHSPVQMGEVPERGRGEPLQARIRARHRHTLGTNIKKWCSSAIGIEERERGREYRPRRRKPAEREPTFSGLLPVRTLVFVLAQSAWPIGLILPALPLSPGSARLGSLVGRVLNAQQVGSRGWFSTCEQESNEIRTHTHSRRRCRRRCRRRQHTLKVVTLACFCLL
jgi:hypothetical protein